MFLDKTPYLLIQHGKDKVGTKMHKFEGQLISLALKNYGGLDRIFNFLKTIFGYSSS